MTPLETLLTEKQAADILNSCPGTLRNWRSRGEGPAWIRFGSAVRYGPDQIREFIVARTRRTTVHAEARG